MFCEKRQRKHLGLLVVGADFGVVNLVAAALQHRPAMMYSGYAEERLGTVLKPGPWANYDGTMAACRRDSQPGTWQSAQAK